MSSPLERDIRARIAAHGPMPVADYMALCLADARHGYYVTRDPLGARGDFITAPEVSQMFGELIGLWMAAVWQQMGAPARARLIELGPGRGTLMSDALRAAKVMPGFLAAASVHFVEISPALKAKQRETLRGTAPPLSWHASLDEVPDGPIIVVANEFFDALPVHQAVKTARGWCERRVGVAGDKLIFTHADTPIAGLEARLNPAEFIRIHRSCILRRDGIRGLRHEGLGVWSVETDGGEALRIGRTYLARVKAMAGR